MQKRKRKGGKIMQEYHWYEKKSERSEKLNTRVKRTKVCLYQEKWLKFRIEQRIATVVFENLLA